MNLIFSNIKNSKRKVRIKRMSGYNEHNRNGRVSSDDGMSKPSEETPSVQSSKMPDTATTIEQQECESLVMQMFTSFMQNCKNPESDDEIVLRKEEHMHFILPVLYNLPQKWTGLDASRPWFVFWLLHACDLFDKIDDIDPSLSDHVATFLNTCQHPDGGFGGGPDQLAHLAPSYAAIMALAIVGRTDVVNRESYYKFLYRVRDETTGGFRMHDEGELDMRGTYCAVASASLLGMITDELFQDVGDYVLSCQNYDGGIAGERGVEAHGGYSFCGLAATTILGQAHRLNLDRLLHWTVHRQMSLEGGYQGRTNKLVDSCYSFWQGAALVVLHEAMRQSGKPVPEDNCWSDPTPLQLYVLLACQYPEGGLVDKPGKRPDYYHTCYSLSGLAASQFGPPQLGFKVKSHDEDVQKYSTMIGPKSDNILRRIDPFYNIRFTRARDLNDKYGKNRNEFVAPGGAPRPECGGIGTGMRRFINENHEQFLEVSPSRSRGGSPYNKHHGHGHGGHGPHAGHHKAHGHGHKDHH